MNETKHLQKSEINQVRILVYDRDETFPNRVIHDLLYEQESACG